MRKTSLVGAAFMMLLFAISIVSAQLSIDISGLEAEEYSLNEEVYFQVLLFDDDNPVSQNVEVTIMDALAKKIVSKSVTSNQDASIPIREDFPSGLWTMTASFEDASVQRTFSIGANLEVEFSLQEDTLVIKNKGNVRYTKTIQITIGDETNSYAQNIGVGEEKRLKLISSQGTYNILVTDGTNTLRRENIQLYGTGNVIGAVDEDLVGYTGFAGVADPSDEEGRFTSLAKLPLATTFVVGILVVGILVLIERRVSRRHHQNAGVVVSP